MSIESAGRPSELVLARTVARQYYIEQKTMLQIAADLRVSRFKVSRLLDVARTSGIVHITIGDAGDINTELSERLRDQLGLNRAVVVNGVDGDNAETRDQLGAIAASLLEEIVTPQDVLGVGWSRAVLCMAEHVRRLKVGEIVQLTGALARRDVTTNIVELVDRLASLSGGSGYSFYAPMFVSDPAAVEAMRRQPEVAAAFAWFPGVTKAVVGVGGWRPPHSTLHDALTPDEQAALQRHDVLADLSGTFVDSSGEPLTMPMNKQVIGISAEQLRSVPEVIGIVYGPEKAPAVRVAVRAGYVGSLVTTAAFAQELLAEERR